MRGPVIARPRPVMRPLVVLVVLVVAVASACGTNKKATGHGPVYVALGDSYTSGAGINPIVDRPCGRSALNYPTLLAKALKVSKFFDRSCSGASTDNLDHPQMFSYTQLNAPQLNAVDAHTTLVTVGMGLNDESVALGLLLVCLAPDGAAPSARCEQYLNLPETEVEAQMKQAAAQVEASLEEIKQKAPQARIVLIGYPRFVPDKGTCPDRLPVPDAQIARMRTGMKYVNHAWQDAARKAGAIYVDMYAASEGHDMCSDDPWESDYKGVLGKAFALHPFASYHKAVAARVEKALAAG